MPTFEPNRPEETIPAAEANRRFSELLRGVREEGRRYIVTSHGRPVARISPPEATGRDDAEREAAWQALRARLQSNAPLNLPRFTRDDFYD